MSAALRKYLHEKVAEYNIPAVDIMGPVLDAVGTIATTKPRMTAGMVHKLDQEYFKKVEAIEFAVKYDDGKNPSGFEKADIVIIGVSRTSKTPLSMFLAYKRLKPQICTSARGTVARGIIQNSGKKSWALL